MPFSISLEYISYFFVSLCWSYDVFLVVPLRLGVFPCLCFMLCQAASPLFVLLSFYFWVPLYARLSKTYLFALLVFHCLIVLDNIIHRHVWSGICAGSWPLTFHEMILLTETWSGQRLIPPRSIHCVAHHHMMQGIVFNVVPHIKLLIFELVTSSKWCEMIKNFTLDLC